MIEFSDGDDDEIVTLSPERFNNITKKKKKVQVPMSSSTTTSAGRKSASEKLYDKKMKEHMDTVDKEVLRKDPKLANMLSKLYKS
jgi:hypothetical protein